MTKSNKTLYLGMAFNNEVIEAHGHDDNENLYLLESIIILDI